MLRSQIVIALHHEPLDLVALTGTDPQDGALCLFVGVVRDSNRGRSVMHLEYEAYEEMAREEMVRIEAEIRSRWPVSDVRLAHRLGRLGVGEPSVAVAVASPHRAEAFAACRYAIDTLKSRVPIWKKEHYADESAWIEDPPSLPDVGKLD
jgi:molybdopterin synthase catalytic subunit